MQTPPLIAYLANLACAPIIRKGLFAGEYVFFGEYMPASLHLYETGSILGYTYRDRLTSFVTLFCEPGHESDLIAHLPKSVSAKLAALDHQPKDFMELYFIPEATRLIRVLRDARLTTYSDWLDFPKLAKHKMRASDIWSPLQFTAAEGIAFGYSQPELAERLFTFEDDPRAWHEARSHGLDIPASSPQAKSIQQRQTEAKALIGPYVAKARPDLLSTLEL